MTTHKDYGNENLYLIGCTHFGHASIIRLANRPFSTTEEMDETMIENWNRVVKPGDTVFHLGDFEYKNLAKKDYKSRLKGNTIWLHGNHDKNVRHHAIYRKVKYKGIECCLFHYPIEEWDGWYKGAYHFHCHTHKAEFKSAERRGNVSVEAIDYTPIHISEAIERVRPHV